MSRSLAFTNLVARKIRHASRKTLPYWYRVTGRLDCGAVLASVEISIPRRFKVLKRIAPVARCTEAWMRHGLDWHNTDRMCWVLDEEWQDCMAVKRKPVASILREGSEWLLAGTANLIGRHYVASLEGLTSWPAEWNERAHMGAGVREYRQERRARETGSQR